MRTFLYGTLFLFVPSLHCFLQLGRPQIRPSSAVWSPFYAKKHRQQCGKHQTSNKNEISQFYRCDRRFAGSFQVQNATGLASLLEQRFLARKGQAQGRPGNQQNVIQRIDRELRQRHNVRVTDRPPIWAPFNSTPPLSFYRQKKEALGKRLDDLFGPLGHPYIQMGESSKASVVDCPLSEPEIHQRLRRIAVCKFLENQELEADALIFELSLLGVRISDKHSGWTSDPYFQFATFESSAHNSGALPMNTTVPTYKPMGVQVQKLENAVRIEQLLSMKSKALATGNHELSDFLALELFKTYNVRCDDVLETWYIDEDSRRHETGARIVFDKDLRDPLLANKAHRDCEKALRRKLTTIPLLFGDNASKFNSPSFVLSNLSEPLESFSDDRVTDLVQQRIHKREEGRFLEADAIRKELWSTYVS